MVNMQVSCILFISLTPNDAAMPTLCEQISALLAICEGNPLDTSASPLQMASIADLCCFL